MSLRRQTPSSLNRHTETPIRIPVPLTPERTSTTRLSTQLPMGSRSSSPVSSRAVPRVALYVQNRIHTLPEEDRKQLNVVYDGMAQSATATYNEHCRAEFAAESIRNYIVNSGTNNHSSSIRRRLLDECRCLARNCSKPMRHRSSLLHLECLGWFSPTYLLEFCQRYDDARVILCGYQAEGHLVVN